MKEAIDIDRANELSLNTDFNFSWKFENFNIYEATVPDRMHMLDLESQSIFWSLLVNSYDKKLMPERSGRWIADFVRFRGIQA